MRVDGQVAVVTGASRGIGRAIAEGLGAAGASVALVARSAGDLERVAESVRAAAGAGGGRAEAFAADVTDREAIDALVERVERGLGPIDLMVNNAGRIEAIGPTWEVDPEEFWRDVTVNLRGVFLGCRAALRRMVERDRGRVVNVVGGGTAKPFYYANGYGSSKAAVQRFTETLDIELRDRGTKVMAFALNPGLVRTEMTERFMGAGEAARWLGRLGERIERGDHYPAENSAELVVRIAAGRLDGLRGRFLNAETDPDELERHMERVRKTDGLTLRVR